MGNSNSKKLNTVVPNDQDADMPDELDALKRFKSNMGGKTVDNIVRALRPACYVKGAVVMLDDIILAKAAWNTIKSNKGTEGNNTNCSHLGDTFEHSGVNSKPFMTD